MNIVVSAPRDMDLAAVVEEPIRWYMVVTQMVWLRAGRAGRGVFVH